MDTISLELAVVDWISLALIILGLVFGLMRGLGTAFAALLWVVAALWLGSNLAPTVLGWMPNTAELDDSRALKTTWGVIAAVIVILPLIGKLVGGSLGRKADDHITHNRYMGGLVGLLLAILVTTAATIFAPRLEVTAGGFGSAFAPEVATTVSDQARFLYPEHFRDELRHEIGIGGVIREAEETLENVGESLENVGESLEEAGDEAVEAIEEVFEPVIDESQDPSSDG